MRDLAFEFGDHVFYKVARIKGAVIFGKKGSLHQVSLDLLKSWRELWIKSKVGFAGLVVKYLWYISCPNTHEVHPKSRHMLKVEHIDAMCNLSYENKTIKIVEQREKILRN